MIVYNELTLQRTSSYNKVPTLHQSQTSVKLSIPVTSGKNICIQQICGQKIRAH